MGDMNRFWIRLITARPRDDRGDVPGWVMITVMSAALVAALLVVARDGLVDLLNAALDQVGS